MMLIWLTIEVDTNAFFLSHFVCCKSRAHIVVDLYSVVPSIVVWCMMVDMSLHDNYARAQSLHAYIHITLYSMLNYRFTGTATNVLSVKIIM